MKDLISFITDEFADWFTAEILPTIKDLNEFNALAAKHPQRYEKYRKHAEEYFEAKQKGNTLG